MVEEEASAISLTGGWRELAVGGGGGWQIRVKEAFPDVAAGALI